jgi:rhodanese-related sulfurtransferase
MRINKVSFTDKTIDQYSVIIDVRTPLEYKEDHIPGVFKLSCFNEQTKA